MHAIHNLIYPTQPSVLHMTIANPSTLSISNSISSHPRQPQVTFNLTPTAMSYTSYGPSSTLGIHSGITGQTLRDNTSLIPGALSTVPSGGHEPPPKSTNRGSFPPRPPEGSGFPLGPPSGSGLPTGPPGRSGFPLGPPGRGRFPFSSLGGEGFPPGPPGSGPFNGGNLSNPPDPNSQVK